VTVHHEIIHHLAPPAAHKALDRAVAHYARRYAKYQPHLKWLGPQDAEVSLTALGVTLKGKVAIIPPGEVPAPPPADDDPRPPAAIRLTANVPLVLRPFMKRALAVLDREVRRWLAAGDADPS
jgi:hypothetical protein